MIGLRLSFILLQMLLLTNSCSKSYRFLGISIYFSLRLLYSFLYTFLDTYQIDQISGNILIHTNITIKKHSNHRDTVKKAVIKGYADRARALCDDENLEAEMQNIVDVFKENGYAEREIREAM